MNDTVLHSCVLPVAVTELDVLVEEAGRRGFLWHEFRLDRHGPEVLAGVFRWGHCADVVVLTDEKGTHAYRTPTDPAIDVFAPSHVYWWYGRIDTSVELPEAGAILPGVGMVWILRALLTLPAPDEPGGLPPLMSAPPGTGVPDGGMPVRLRRWPGRGE